MSVTFAGQNIPTVYVEKLGVRNSPLGVDVHQWRVYLTPDAPAPAIPDRSVAALEIVDEVDPQGHPVANVNVEQAMVRSADGGPFYASQHGHPGSAGYFEFRTI